MSAAMTDFMHSSGAASIGFGKRIETINKEVLEYPAPGMYEQRKNDKITDPEVRQRKRIKFTIPEEKKREARRKKDRVDTDPRMKRDQRLPIVVLPTPHPLVKGRKYLNLHKYNLPSKINPNNIIYF